MRYFNSLILRINNQPKIGFVFEHQVQLTHLAAEQLLKPTQHAGGGRRIEWDCALWWRLHWIMWNINSTTRLCYVLVGVVSSHCFGLRICWDSISYLSNTTGTTLLVPYLTLCKCGCMNPNFHKILDLTAALCKTLMISCYLATKIDSTFFINWKKTI